MNRELPQGANAVAFAGCIVLALLSSMISPPAGGQATNAAPPPRVERAFIAYVGGDFGHYANANDRGADRLYRVFFADLAKWGRYEIVSDPARADWVFQIDAANSSRCVPNYGISPRLAIPWQEQDTHYEIENDDWVELVVIDLKRDVQRRFVEHLYKSNPSSTAASTFDRAVAAVLDDFSEQLSEPRGEVQVQHLDLPVPVPPRIGSAHTIFVTDISENDADADRFSAGGARLYSQLTQELRSWGRYELVNSAARADLILEASFQVYWRCDGSGDRRFRLFITDPATGVLLWGLTAHAKVPFLSSDFRGAFDEGVAGLVNQFRGLAETPTWAAGDSIPASPPAPALEAASAEAVSATISMPKNVVKSGSAVTVEVAVKNSLKEDLEFKYREGDPLTCVLSVRDADGNAAPFTEQGRTLLELHATRRGRLRAYTLFPGETQRRQCAFDELYDVSHPGKYSIQLQQLDGRPADSNSLVLTVVP
jgi:hypothetical protein